MHATRVESNGTSQQTLNKLAQAVRNRDLKILITHLADTYNARNDTHLRAPAGFHRLWWEPLLLSGFRGVGGLVGGRRTIVKNSESNI